MLYSVFRFCCIFLFIALSGCSYLLPQGGRDTLQGQLDKLHHWQVRGKLAVRSPAENGTGYLTWKQSNQEYDLYIAGPFGAGSSRLVGNEHRASLSLPGWPAPKVASSAEDLMKLYMGWDFPVMGIRYWVKGQPAPDAKFESTFNDNGLLSELKQHGWHIQYSRYQLQQGHWLPGLIKITGHEFRFTFAISQWTLFSL